MRNETKRQHEMIPTEEALRQMNEIIGARESDTTHYDFAPDSVREHFEGSGLPPADYQYFDALYRTPDAILSEAADHEIGSGRETFEDICRIMKRIGDRALGMVDSRLRITAEVVATLALLGVAALPHHDDEWGSERQTDAYDAFHKFALAWGLTYDQEMADKKAVEREMVDMILERASKRIKAQHDTDMSGV